MSQIHQTRDTALTDAERLDLIDWIHANADQPGTGDLMTHDQLFEVPLFARVLSQVQALTEQHWPEFAGKKRQALGVHLRVGNHIRPHNHLASSTLINALYYLNDGAALHIEEDANVHTIRPEPGVIVACPGGHTHWVDPQPPPDDRYSIVVCWVSR